MRQTGRGWQWGVVCSLICGLCWACGTEVLSPGSASEGGTGGSSAAGVGGTKPAAGHPTAGSQSTGNAGAAVLAGNAGAGGVSPAAAGADDAEAGSGGEGGAEAEVFCTGSRMIHNDSDLARLAAEGCTELEGALTIYGGDLAQGPGLPALRKIGSGLIVTANKETASLAALSHVESVGRELMIAENPELTSLHGLEHLEQVETFVLVQLNPKLDNFEGLGVKKAGGHVTLLGTFSSLEGLKLQEAQRMIIGGYVTNLTGLGDLLETGQISLRSPDLTTLVGLNPDAQIARLSIDGAPLLTSLGSLKGLHFAGLDVGGTGIDSLADLAGLKQLDALSIYDNPKLASLAPLASLENVGFLAVEMLPLLTDLAGLENIKHVSESVSITRNDALTNIDALYDWPVGSVASTAQGQGFYFIQNAQLKECDVDALVTHLNATCVSCSENSAAACN